MLSAAILAVLAAQAAATQPPPGRSVHPGTQPATQAAPKAAPDSTSTKAAPAAEAPAAGDWRARWDALWPDRDEKANVAKLDALVKEAEAKDPGSFDLLARKAQWLAWKADGMPDGDAKADTGKQAWETADQAILAKPDDVRGHYFAAVGIGLYSEGVGILTALSQGLEGKFRERIGRAIKIDKNFLDGAPQHVWGRFFYKLPWPKRDNDQSEAILRQVVKEHPTDLRGRLFLAETLDANDKSSEAKSEMRQITLAPMGRDPAEDRRVKSRAKHWLSQH